MASRSAVRPRLLLSMCLGVKPVRHDGGIVFDVLVEALKRYVEVVAVCPEVGIGLGVPRSPLVLNEIEGRVELVDTSSGLKLTRNVEEFTERILEGLAVDGVLLKSASPSCGVGDAKIYGPGRQVLRRGDGIFTSLLKRRMPCIPFESEKRLYSYGIRRTFLTRLFSLAELRGTLSSLKSREDLVDFHRRYKYIIMLYSPTALKHLGRLIARRESCEIQDLAARYRDGFTRALCRNPSRGSYANVLTHVYGHLKWKLNPSERKYVLSLIEGYKAGRESLRTVVSYFRGFVHRFGVEYLAEQRFLSPYPDELDNVGLELE
ncbi:MAG: DUF523 and DUF1722 domain-containing protein [Thermofilaceae archaeon]